MREAVGIEKLLRVVGAANPGPTKPECSRRRIATNVLQVKNEGRRANDDITVSAGQSIPGVNASGGGSIQFFLVSN